MRKMTKLLAGAVLGLMGLSANAAITVTQTVTPGIGPLTGFQINRFYAQIKSGSPEATAGALGLQSASVTLDVDQNHLMKVTIASISGGAAVNDADISGQESSMEANQGAIDPRTDNANVGTFIRVGDSSFAPWAPQYVEGNPGPGVNLTGKNLSSASNPQATVEANFKNTKHLRVDGILTGDVDPQAKTDSVLPTAGSLFAMVVTPIGVNGTAHIQLAADKGAISTTDQIILPVPEPTTLGLLGIGAVGLLARRRRA